jgi:uncharacterized membrane protein HdeD (DUF308 family)
MQAPAKCRNRQANALCVCLAVKQILAEDWRYIGNPAGRPALSTREPDSEQLRHEIVTSVQSHWRFCLAEGIVLIILGMAAVIIPYALMVEFQFGWLFVLSGITGLTTTLYLHDAPGFRWSLVSAILAIVAGVLMVASPTKVLSLTLILILFFMIEGVASIMYALGHRRDNSGNWSWMLGSGIIDLFLAATIVVGLPGSAKWALGLLIGANLITGGLALIAMGLHGRALSSNAAA